MTVSIAQEAGSPAGEPHDAAPSRAGTARAAAALVLLSIANCFNLADRMLLGVVQESIRQDFNLSDFQLGLLGGTAFAILYAILSVPIARLADRRNRITIISVALGLWSAMTAICGLAGSFVQLLIARAGVSVGEAGGVAPALSYFSDIFSPRRRGTAMAVFAIGGPGGALMATVVGAWITRDYGWRWAFIAFGLAGVALAILIRLVLREVRPDRPDGKSTSLIETLRILSKKRSYVHVCMAGIFAAFCATFIMQYMTSFLMRVHGLSLPSAALVTGLAGGVFGMIGAFGAGWAADRIAVARPQARTLILSGTFAVAAMALGLAWWTPLVIAVPLLLLGAMCMNAYPGVSYAVSSLTAPAPLRATAIAIFTVTGNLLGYALGPPIFGALSDFAGARIMDLNGIGQAACTADGALAACAAAQGDGLRWALTAAALLLFGGAFHNWRASRTLAADIED